MFYMTTNQEYFCIDACYHYRYLKKYILKLNAYFEVVNNTGAWLSTWLSQTKTFKISNYFMCISVCINCIENIH